jgi:hypothetical protein
LSSSKKSQPAMSSTYPFESLSPSPSKAAIRSLASRAPSDSAWPSAGPTRGSSAKSSTSNAPSPLQSSCAQAAPPVVCGVGSSASFSATFLRSCPLFQRMPVSRIAISTSGRPMERFQARSADTPETWPSGLRPAVVFCAWRRVTWASKGGL